MEKPKGKAPAGWYDAPEIAGLEQYWNGKSWSSKKRIPGQPLIIPQSGKFFFSRPYLQDSAFKVFIAFIALNAIFRVIKNIQDDGFQLSSSGSIISGLIDGVFFVGSSAIVTWVFFLVYLIPRRKMDRKLKEAQKNDIIETVENELNVKEKIKINLNKKIIITVVSILVVLVLFYVKNYSPGGTASSPTPVSALTCKQSSATGSTAKDLGTPSDLLPAKSYTFSLQTNCGDIEISADAAKAPITVSTLAFLTQGGFYNGTVCHRLTTQGLYVLQCGDPTGTGSGGPNFTFKDENLPAQVDNNYPAGSVAMANSGPSTNGSQFFLVYADTTLGANYTLWGKITKGLDIVKAIAEFGTADGSGDGAPKATVEIINAIVK